MPHFVIDCSENILHSKSAEEIISLVYDTAESTGLFNPQAINVRLNIFRDFKAGINQQAFISIFASIMEGRTHAQKNDLSRKIVSNLVKLFPDVPLISMNVRDIEKASYIDKSMM